jgi:hypothetical protein
MTVAFALVLLLLAPDKDPAEKAPAGKAKTYKLAYHFDKDDQYLETTTREFRLEIIQGKSLAVTEVAAKESLDRTVLETKKGRPVIERIVVKDFSKDVKKSPLQKSIGVTKSEAIGRKFVWRRIGDERWGLFTERAEVTAQYRPVVARLKNWRDNRLPKAPVKVGEKWTIAAADYLATLGQDVPKGTTGNMEFTLKSVDEKGVATISISGVWSYLEPGTRVVVTQSGTWTFDSKKGRDLKMESAAEIDMSGAMDGKARLKMTRVVAWKKK